MFGMIPFNRSERNLFNYLDQIERNFRDDDFAEAMQFRCDVQDAGDAYLLEAELPGFDRKDIDVNLEGSALVISAKRDSKTETKSKDGSFLRRERKRGSFCRSFDATDIDVERVRASYKNGVLKLTLPKKNVEPPSARRIEISEE